MLTKLHFHGDPLFHIRMTCLYFSLFNPSGIKRFTSKLLIPQTYKKYGGCGGLDFLVGGIGIMRQTFQPVIFGTFHH